MWLKILNRIVEICQKFGAQNYLDKDALPHLK